MGRLPYSHSNMSDSNPTTTNATSMLSPSSGAIVPVGPPAFQQTITHAFANGSAATSESLAFNSAVQSGSMLVVVAFWVGSVTASITDNQGNVYSTLGLMNPSGTSFGQFFYAPLAKPGATTVQISLSGAGGTFIEMILVEYSGVSKLDQHDIAATGNSVFPTANSVTTTQAKEAVLGFVIVASNAASWTQGTGYTTRGTGTIACNIEDQFVSSSGAFAPSYQIGAQAWQMGVATFY